MDKDKLENELASAIMHVMMKHVETGYSDSGFGEFLECKIDFKYLHNKGALLVKGLNFNSGSSEIISEKKNKIDNLEMLLFGLFPNNKIEVFLEGNSVIHVNVDDKKIKFTYPIDPIDSLMFPSIDFAMEYSHLIVDEIKKLLNSK